MERIIKSIEELGSEALFFNVNAADSGKRQEVIESLKEKLDGSEGPRTVRVLLHSLAFGTLKPYIAPSAAEAITNSQMGMTLDVMANSLVYWAQDLVASKLLGKGGRIFALTSSGGSRVWPSYGAVSAAKAALESHIRQLALELAPLGITANAIRAGVTDTPALRKIPGNERMIKEAQQRNPAGRLTTTLDVAEAMVALTYPNTHWLTGNVIGVDGGEDIVG